MMMKITMLFVFQYTSIEIQNAMILRRRWVKHVDDPRGPCSLSGDVHLAVRELCRDQEQGLPDLTQIVLVDAYRKRTVHVHVLSKCAFQSLYHVENT